MKNLFLPLCFATVTAAVCARENPFDAPNVHGDNALLHQALNAAIQSKDHAAMEEATRRGVELRPDDANWNYNHACALALLGRGDEAIKFLTRAVEVGFTNAAWIEADEDFVSIRERDDFKAQVEAARNAKPSVAATMVDTNSMTAVISQENVMWDFGSAVFRAFFAFPEKAPGWWPGTYNGAEAALVRAWAEDGTAAGLYGVLYDNRCDGHSRLNVRDFPGLSLVVYGDEAKQRGLHWSAARFFYNTAVIGNASVAQTAGPFWRSVPRLQTSDPHQNALLYAYYMSNHLYVYPCHVDYRQGHLGDVFVVNTPCIVTSLGSSGSDQVFLRALFSALSAFTPETQAFLAQSGRLAPTLNFLLRWTQTHFETKEDYFTGAAHRPALDGARIDANAMTRLAHEMTTNSIPPLVGVRLESAPPTARQGVECFDLNGGELALLTPVSGSFIMRGPAQKRSFKFAAFALPPGVTDTMEYRWAVLQGPAGHVEITPLNADNTEVEVTLTHPPAVPWRENPDNEDSMPTSRVDIGVFANNGAHWSPPAILSFYYLANEQREYGEDGRLVKVDYAAAAGRYADPVYTLPKRWADVYQYDAAGALLGWERQRGADNVEAFTADGFKIETRDELGRAATARVVEYLRRDAGGAGEISQADTTRVVTYAYAGPDDLRGTFEE